jgi:hypothetical protein
MYQTPVLAMIVLATSSSGSRFSLDNLIRRERSTRSEQRAGFFIKFVHFLICLMYFKAGFSKIRITGIAWLTDDYLLGHLRTAYSLYASNYSQLGHHLHAFVLERPELVRLGAASTLLIELTSLLPLFFVRLTPLYILLWVTFHISIYLLMGISSSYWLLPLLAFFLPWDKIIKHKEGTA